MGTLFILNIDIGEKTGLILAGWGSQERYLRRSEGTSGYFKSFWGKKPWLFNMYNFTSRLKTFPFGSREGKRRAILQYLKTFWKTKGKEEWNSRGSVCPIKVTWGRISQNRKKEASFIWHGVSGGLLTAAKYFWFSPHPGHRGGLDHPASLGLSGTPLQSAGQWVESRSDKTIKCQGEILGFLLSHWLSTSATF